MTRASLASRLGIVAGLLLLGSGALTEVAAGAAAGAPAAQQAVAVDMLAGPTRFEPAEITVPVGTTVTWTTRSGSHTTTSDTGLWDSGERLPVGQSFSFTFTAPGEYAYYCTPHRDSGMVGKVTVTP